MCGHTGRRRTDIIDSYYIGVVQGRSRITADPAHRDASRAAILACSANDKVGFVGGGLRDGVRAAPGAWA